MGIQLEQGERKTSLTKAAAAKAIYELAFTSFCNLLDEYIDGCKMHPILKTFVRKHFDIAADTFFERAGGNDNIKFHVLHKDEDRVKEIAERME